MLVEVAIGVTSGLVAGFLVTALFVNHFIGKMDEIHDGLLAALIASAVRDLEET